MLATCNRIEVFAEVERFHGASPTSAGCSPVRPARPSRSSPRTSPCTTRTRPSPTSSPSPRAWTRWSSARRRCWVSCGGLRPGPRGGHRGPRAAPGGPACAARRQAGAHRDRHRPGRRLAGLGRARPRRGADRALRDRRGPRRRRRLHGRLAATTLARRGAAVVVSSRTEAHAARLAESVGGRAAPLGDLPAELAAADLLVTCTGATGLVIRTDVVAGAMAGGRTAAGRRRPGPARDVDPGVAALPGVHVVDLALLQSERAATRGGPPTAVVADDIAAAHALVEAETALLRAERQAAAVAPTVPRCAARRRGRRRRAAAAVQPAARPRHPCPGRGRPHRAPRRRQAAARADRPGEGTRRGSGRHRLRRCAARPLRARHRRPGRGARRRRHRRPRPALRGGS